MTITDAPARSPGAPGLPDGTPVPAAACAGPWARGAALAVDAALVAVAWAVASLAVRVVGGRLGLSTGMCGAIASMGNLAIAAAYFASLESSTSQGTFGKMAMGLQVVDLRGGPITFGRALLRFLAKLGSAAPFLIGFVLAGLTERGRALHDLLVGTLVVRGDRWDPAAGVPQPATGR